MGFALESWQLPVIRTKRYIEEDKRRVGSFFLYVTRRGVGGGLKILYSFNVLCGWSPTACMCSCDNMQEAHDGLIRDTPKTVYMVAICPRGNLPYIQNCTINDTVFNLNYPVGSWIHLPYK